MSRVLNALRNLQQQPQSPPIVAGDKVTPRLAASIRRAVLGPQAGKRFAERNADTPPVLFGVPHLTAPAALPADTTAGAAADEAIAKPREPVQPSVCSPRSELPSTNPLPGRQSIAAQSQATDPLSLVDAIAATLRDVAAETPCPQVVASPPVAEPVPSVAPLAAPAAAETLPPATAPVPQNSAIAQQSPSVSQAISERRETPGVPSAEPYRGLLQAISRDTQAYASPVVALIGLDELEPTSEVAATLSTLLAQQGQGRVLLVEAHGSNRSLAQRYDAVQAAGLCESLTGRGQGNSGIVATQQGDLFFLPFGRPHAEQGEQLMAGLADHLRGIGGDYRMVVIDAGPLQTPCAIAASRSAHATYLLVRLGESLAEQAVTEVNRFRAAGGKLSGCIAICPENQRSIPS